MSGYNLPESTGPNDPEAPWNKDSDDDGTYICIVCGRPATYELADEFFCDEHRPKDAR